MSLPNRDTEEFPPDLVWIAREDDLDDGSPTIFVNAELESDERHQATVEAYQAYKRDLRRRRGLVAVPLLGLDKVKQVPKPGKRAVLVVGAAVLVAAVAVGSSLLPGDGHETRGRRPLAKAPTPPNTAPSQPGQRRKPRHTVAPGVTYAPVMSSTRTRTRPAVPPRKGRRRPTPPPYSPTPPSAHPPVAGSLWAHVNVELGHLGFDLTLWRGR